MAGKKLKASSTGTGNTAQRVVLGVTFVASLGICSMVPHVVGDDFVYLSLAKASPGFFNFLLGYLVEMRDGRIATAASIWLVYTNGIWLWKLCNAAVVTLFCFLVCEIACLITREKQPRLMPQVVVCASLTIINSIIVAVSMFTVCFSLHYLWACTAGLLALYYPVKEAVYPGENKTGTLPYCLIAASVYACLSQEQVAAVVVAFLLIITIYRHCEYRKQMHRRGKGKRREEAKKFRFLYIQTALSLAAFMVLLISQALMDRQYHLASYGDQRVFRILQWLVYNYTKYAGYVLILLWILLFLRFLQKKRPVYAILCALFAAIAILSMLLPALTDVGLVLADPKAEDIYQLTEYLPALTKLSVLQGIVLAWWLFAIGFTPLLLLKAQKDEPMRYAALLLYLAGGAAACLITMTNVMYSAMGRTFIVTIILLVMIVASLIPPIKKPKHMLIAACVLVLLTAAQLRENLLPLIATFFSLVDHWY